MERDARNSGSVLILALWAVAVLAVLVFSVGSQASLGVRMMGSELDRMREKSLCGAAVALAEQVLENDSPVADSYSDSWADDQGSFKAVRLSEGSVSVHRTCSDSSGSKEVFGLEDEQGRLNLNNATLEILTALPGMTPEAAASIIDWRDADGQPLPGGAEDAYYMGLWNPYHCKNGPLQSIHELMLIHAVTPEIYRKIEPWVTVYGNGRININTAPAAVLASLGLSVEAQAAILNFRRGRDGQEGTADDGIFKSVSGIIDQSGALSLSATDLERIRQFVSKGVITVKSSHFRLHIEVEPSPRTVASYEAVIGSDSSRRRWKIEHCERVRG